MTAEYAESVCGVVPGAELVRFERAGATVGFWAVQRRGDTLQPIAAPLTDYQQVISVPEARRDLASFTKAVGASRYAFTGLASSHPPAGAFERRAMVADIRAGYAAYYNRRKRLYPKYFKDKLRLDRHLEEACGLLSFAWHDPDPTVFDWLLAKKRDQFNSTAQYDVFSCGWTRRVLHRLLEVRTENFGGSIFTVRDDNDRVIAAIYTLRAGPVCHVWFPTYDRDLSRYSPGAISMLGLMRLSENQGINFVDFGLEG